MSLRNQDRNECISDLSYARVARNEALSPGLMPGEGFRDLLAIWGPKTRCHCWNPDKADCAATPIRRVMHVGGMLQFAMRDNIVVRLQDKRNGGGKRHVQGAQIDPPSKKKKTRECLGLIACLCAPSVPVSVSHSLSLYIVSLFLSDPTCECASAGNPSHTFQITQHFTH